MLSRHRVAGGAPDEIVARHDGRNVRGAVGNPGVAPQKLAGVRVNGHDAARLAEQRDIHRHLADLGLDGRGVASAARVLNLGPPNLLARFLVECDNRGLIAAGRADELVAIDKRRLAVAPARHHLAAEVVAEPLLPNRLAGLGVERREIAAGGENVDPPSRDDRRAVRFRAIVRIDLTPDFASVRFVARPGDVLSANAAGAVDRSPDDRHRREASAAALHAHVGGSSFGQVLSRPVSFRCPCGRDRALRPVGRAKKRAGNCAECNDKRVMGVLLDE